LVNNFNTNLNILYVEDEKGIRDNLKYYLETSFKKVFTASNGQKGIQIFKKEFSNIDLIITDIHMPIISGLEMIKEIKTIDAKIPFLITTAYNDKEYLLEAIELGVTNYLTKPIDIDILFDKIESTATISYEQKLVNKLVKKMSTSSSLNIEDFFKKFDEELNNITDTHILLYDNFKYCFKEKIIKKENSFIKLNNQEILLIECLIKNKNSVVDYLTLQNAISKDKFSLETLRTIVKFIRNKTSKKLITTLSGVGYKVNTNLVN
jgi:DNA-binding response OmpR family regulator